MTDRNLADLHPKLQPLCQQWLDKCHQQSIDARVIETYRSTADQDKDWQVGRDAQGNIIGKTITKAKGGQSPHNTTLADGTPASCAFDWFIMDGAQPNWDASSVEWETAVQIGKSLGLVWGGDFPRAQMDCDHFELPNWRETANQQ